MLRTSCVWIALVCVLALGCLEAYGQCPAAPTGLAVEIGRCGNRLSFTLNGPTVGVRIYRENSLIPNFDNAQLIGTVPTSVLDRGQFQFVDNSRPIGFMNYWAVAQGAPAFCNQSFPSEPFVVFNNGNTGFLGFLSVTPLCGRVHLSWPGTFDDLRYNLYRSASFGTQGELIAANLVDESFFVDSSGTPGTQYFYTLQLTKCDGNTIASAQTQGVYPGPPSVVFPFSYTFVNAGENAELTNTIRAVGTPGTWVWERIDGGPANADRMSVNASTGHAELADVRPSDTGEYRVKFVSSCSSEVSAQVALVVRGNACPADFDGSGAIGVNDIFAFLSAWFAGCQ